MEQISKNFNISEFSASAIASAEGINNEIPETIKPAVRALVLKLLQPICDANGWGCTITSGYRCKTLNSRVGGTPNSQHTKGEASDTSFFERKGREKVRIKPIEVLRAVADSGVVFDQMIAYNGFVHLSLTDTGENRKQVLYNKSYTGERI